MALTKDDWKWLVACSGGAVAFPAARKGELSEAEDLSTQLDAKLAKQGAEERALKDSLITAALAELEKTREPMRDTSKFDTKVKGKLFGTNTVKTGGDVAQRDAWDARQDGPKTVSVSDKSGLGGVDRAPRKPGEEGDPKADPKDVKAGKSQKGQLADLMGQVIAKSDELGDMTTQRWYIDKDGGKLTLKTRTEPLFGDGEIMKELWTPLTREKIIGDNFIPDRFSQTQKMLDGSNEHYVKECKEKGGDIGYNLTTLAKGSVELASSVTQTVLAALGPVSTASATGVLPGNVTQVGMAGGQPLEKDKLAQATQITVGIAALLTTTLDGIDKADEARKAGTFSLTDFRSAVNGIGLTVGRLVAAGTGVDALGLAITDGVAAGMAAVDIGAQVASWVKDGKDGDFNWRELYGKLGAAMARGIASVSASTLAAASDNTSGDLSTDLAHASKVAEKAFNTAAVAMEKEVVTLVANGQWKQVFALVVKAGGEAAATLPNILKYDAEYNTGETLADQTKSSKTATAVNDGVAKMQDGMEKATDALLDKVGEKRADRRAAKGKGEPDGNKRQQRDKEIKDAFDKRQKEMEDKLADDQLAQLAAQGEKEKKEYRDSLSCLGSTNPTDAEFKTIAKLMADIDKDRAIWAVITGIASGGAAVASVFVPALKGVGELAQFVANIKAAADRLSAMLDWMSARKDAKSAVSPYATAFENMFTNQRAQMAQYSVQAAANAVKALLAAGELSPYAPAFKVAGAAVGAAAKAEELIYKAYNQAALVKSWKTTKKALDDPKNRKLGLIARELNPTLAKYTIAYGALIAKDEVAIRAMGAIGLDRETLTRTGDKVSDVKDYMQKLYVDDNVVLGRIGPTQAKVKVPDAQLTAKAWTTSVMLWQRADGVEGKPPAKITQYLVIAEEFRGTRITELKPAQAAMYERALGQLIGAFGECRADAVGSSTAQGAALYADHAFARLEALRLERSGDLDPQQAA